MCCFDYVLSYQVFNNLFMTFLFLKLMLPYVRLNDSASFFWFFYDKFGRKIPYHLSFAKILFYILCKMTSFLSFSHKSRSLSLSSHVSQSPIHPYVFHYCKNYFVVHLKFFQGFPHIQFSHFCKFSSVLM